MWTSFASRRGKTKDHLGTKPKINENFSRLSKYIFPHNFFFCTAIMNSFAKKFLKIDIIKKKIIYGAEYWET